MAESTENCMKTGDCFALLAMTFETCDLLNYLSTHPSPKNSVTAKRFARSSLLLQGDCFPKARNDMAEW